MCGTHRDNILLSDIYSPLRSFSTVADEASPEKNNTATFSTPFAFTPAISTTSCLPFLGASGCSFSSLHYP